MKIASINVGLPREVKWQGRSVTTGFFKEPIQGAVMLRTLNLDGDGQADLSVHGGPTKAVYVYPIEHYPFWQNELPGTELPLGAFGENFTTAGLLETDVHIGDRFRIGNAEVIVTEPRMPCFKLAVKFGRSDMLQRVLFSRRSGFYLGVLREGEVRAGDIMEELGGDGNDVSVADVVRLYAFEPNDIETMRRAVRAQALPAKWRSYFLQQLSNA